MTAIGRSGLVGVTGASATLRVVKSEETIKRLRATAARRPGAGEYEQLLAV